MDQIFVNKVKPTIVGGGIGGLTLAIGLQKHGIASKIYEAAPDINEVGAGIMLASNAMQVFKDLGIYEELAELGNHISTMKITDAKFGTLSNINLKPFEEKYGVHNVTIHRAVLQRKLIEVVGKEHLFLGRKLQKLEAEKGEIVADFGNESVSSKVLIGADGINSTVRQFVNPNATIRKAYQKCWRGVTEFNLPQEYTHTAIEAWGKGSRFGLTRLNEKQVYWYALVNSTDMEEAIVDLFDEFHPMVKEIIAATKPSAIIENEIIDLKPIKNWHKENICLLGDAAHATTPNMGQGACQAIEDAFVLANYLGREEDPKLAFELFRKKRIRKAHQIVNGSWRVGKMSQWENPLARGFRDFAMRLSPDHLAARQLQSVFDLSYAQN